MKRRIPFLFATCLILGGLIFSASARPDADDKKPVAVNKESGKEAEKEPVIRRDDDGNIIVHIEDELQKKAGIQTSDVVATNLSPEFKAYGKVLDPSPMISLLNEMAMAEAAGNASSKELGRLKELASSGNATERAIQAAEAAKLKDELTLQSAKDRLMLSFGKELASRQDLYDLSRSLGTAASALVRAELPAGQPVNETPKGARIVTLSGSSVIAEVVGLSLNVDFQSQGKAWLLLVKTNNANLLSGEATTVFIQTSGEPAAGFFIPSSAVVRAEGKPWIYLVKDEDHFFKREISTALSLEGGWFVRDSVKAGEKLVTTGAQSAFSEEVKGALGSED